LKAKLRIDGKEFWLGNPHGTAYPGDKKDSEIRISQSKTILNSFKEDGPKIIGGDFNLLRDTRSISILEEVGYRNLISEFNIKSTRNKVAWDRFKNDPNFVKQYDSDFCFVSKEIKVKNFEVPNIEASDHEPLILDFGI